MLVTAELLLRLTPEEREELRATLRREDLSPRVRERLEMVKAADLGHDLGQITAWSGRTPRTVRRWLGGFARGGGGGRARRARCAAGWARSPAAGSGRSPPPAPHARGVPSWPAPPTLGRWRRRSRPRRAGWAWASRGGPQSGFARTCPVRARSRYPPVGCGHCSPGGASPAGEPSTPSSTLGTPRRWSPARPSSRRPKKSGGRAPAPRAALPGRDAPGDQPLPV